MNKTEFHFPSATGVCEIAGFTYTPENSVFDTVLVIHHGMAEHQQRYLGFIEALCRNGIAVYMHDMANHGLSNQDEALTGWFGEKDGWLGLIADFRTTVLKARDENPDKKLVVMGHSMGSFICRMYTARHPEDGFRGAVYMGTGGPNPASAAGKALAGMLGVLAGKKRKSGLLAKMAFGTYGKRFEGRTEYDWLTREKDIVDRYVADPWCGFLFTVQGMHDLIEVNAASNAAEWYAAVPADLPILLIAGGYEKNSDFTEFIESFHGKVKELLLLGATAQRFAQTALRCGFPKERILFCESMKECVQKASLLAERGDTVLLSPASASWGMYNNYEERGDDFRRLALALNE